MLISRSKQAMNKEAKQKLGSSWEIDHDFDLFFKRLEMIVENIRSR